MRRLMTIIAILMLMWMILFCALSIYLVARAEEAHEVVPVRITGYCLKGKTASGIEGAVESAYLVTHIPYYNDLDDIDYMMTHPVDYPYAKSASS